MGRQDEELPWALVQDVSTRWNSQLACMKSILRSEAAVRHVLESGHFTSLKTLVRLLVFEFWINVPLPVWCQAQVPPYRAAQEGDQPLGAIPSCYTATLA